VAPILRRAKDVSAVLSASTEDATAGFRRWRPLAMLALIPLALAASGVFVAIRGRGHAAQRSPAPSESAASSPFRTSLELWKLGERWTALSQLRSAIDADPDYAPAHLMSVLFADSVEVKLRQRYVIAQSHSWMLSPREREFLTAIGPAMSDPPQWGAALEALAAMHRADPADMLITTVFANKLLRTGKPDQAADLLQASHFPRDWPIASDLYAVALVELGKEPDARSELARCVDATPAAAACARSLATLASRTGQCQLLEPLGRQLTALAPDSPEGYAFLASSQYSSHRALADVEATLEERWRRIPPSLRAMATLQDRVTLHLAYGDTESALRYLAEWRAVSMTQQEPSARSLPLIFQVLIQSDMSDDAGARAAARLLREESFSFPWSDWADPQANALQVEYHLNMISRSAMTTQRGEMLARRPPSSYADARRWLNFYATMISTPEDAAEALQQMPSRLPSLFERDAETELDFGLMFDLAHRSEEAKHWLSLAASQCAIEDFDSSIRGGLALGLSLERHGNHVEACHALDDVVRRGHASAQSRTIRAAKHHLDQFHCITVSTKD
jgi:tetratricopeptide (TPR) repeat protein